MTPRIVLGILLVATTACNEGSSIGKQTTGGGGTAGGTGNTTGAGSTTAGTTGGQGTDSTTGGGGVTVPGATVSTATAGDANGLQFDVFIFAKYNICIIGDMCTGGATCSTSIKNNVSGIQFTDNANLRIVAPGDPNIANASYSICISPVMSQGDQNAVAQTLTTSLHQQINADTNSTLPIKFLIHTVTLDANTGVSFSYPASTPRQNWYMASGDVMNIIKPFLTKNTSFVLVTGNLRADDVGFEVVPICSNTETGDVIAGASYSWIAKTADGFATDCFDLSHAQYEWEQQLAWGINTFSGFTSIYPNYTYTGSCGSSNNPNKWFPRPGDCQIDRDWSQCTTAPGGNGPDCNTDGAFMDHILTSHWVPGRAVYTNHCQNGVKDYGETSVDSGGDCPAN